MNFIFSKHAIEQIKKRKISMKVIEEVLANPVEIVVFAQYKIYQSIIEEGKFLIRIFVNENTNPFLVITVYKTSKIRKYYEGKI